MRTLRYFGTILLSVLIAFGISSCGGDDDSVDPTPTPVVAKIEIPETENTNPVFATEGGTATVTFSTTQAWTATVIGSDANSWLTVTPMIGSAGKATLSITSKENDTTDDRSATITIKCGTVSQNITISQKQKDALTINSNKIEVDAEGGEIQVEVRANIEFSVETDVDWITQADTRAMKATNLSFAIAKNENTAKREGHITITSGALSETITVYQSEFTPIFSLAQKEYTLDVDGGQVNVEVKSNVELKITLPNNDWINQSATEKVSDDETIYVFVISKNDTYDERKAEIVFSNDKYGLEEKVKITQDQLDAIIVNKKDFSFSIEGGSFDVEVKSNVDYGVDINAGWIWYSTTRALNTSQLHFDVEANDTAESRQAIITLYAGDTKQEISVQQRGVIFVSSIKLNKTSLELLEGETAQLTATISPSNADHKELQWYSQNDWIASVDENGLITAINEGTTIIEVYADNWRIKAECQVTVKKQSFTNGNESFGNEKQEW